MAKIYNYKTGEYLREAKDCEWSVYVAEIEGDRTGTGAVDGEPYGFPFTIYMED